MNLIPKFLRKPTRVPAEAALAKSRQQLKEAEKAAADAHEKLRDALLERTLRRQSGK